MSFTLTHFIDREQSVILNHKVVERIHELNGLSIDDRSDDEWAELVALRNFWDELEGRSGAPFDALSIVPADELADFLRFEAEERGDVQPGLAGYVDWEKYARNSRGDFYPFAFGDDEHYLVRGY